MSQLEIIEMICSYTEYTLKFNELMSSLNKKILILFYDTIMNNLDKIPDNKKLLTNAILNYIYLITPYRVRHINKMMNFTDINKKGIIPKKPNGKAIFYNDDFPQLGGKFPKILNKMGPSLLGSFVDVLFQITLNERRLPNDAEILIVCLKVLSEQGGAKKMFSPIELLKEKDYFFGLCRWLLKNIPQNLNQINQEWTYGIIQGHPDVVTNDTVYDIKMTGRFSKMRSDTILQVLSYFCLAKKLKMNNITHIGLILPAQLTIIRVNLSKWNWKPFWNFMVNAVDDIKHISDNSKKDIENIVPYVGSHVRKIDGSVYKGLYKELEKKTPLQIFLTGNCGGEPNLKQKEIDDILHMVLKNNLVFFVHAPYSINLCHTENSEIPKQKKKSQDDVECKYTTYKPSKMLSQYIAYTRKMGGTGTVVHCGHKTDKSMDLALATMAENINNAVENGMATKESRLLIETGSGSEICSDINQLVIFYNDFLNEETKQVSAICLDTCHVFAAGFMPMDAIKILEDAKIPIALIHYNDSKFGFNSKKDRHAIVGSGKIPIEQMINVAKWAIGKGIPMVHE